MSTFRVASHGDSVFGATAWTGRESPQQGCTAVKKSQLPQLPGLGREKEAIPRLGGPSFGTFDEYSFFLFSWGKHPDFPVAPATPRTRSTSGPQPSIRPENWNLTWQEEGCGLQIGTW